VREATRALLRVRGLVQRYELERATPFGARRFLEAVGGVSFDVAAGEVLGIVGESGCGKSSVAKAVLGASTPSEGRVHFDGRDITRPTPAQWRALRRDIQYVFQDPLGALDPRMRILDQVVEPLVIHGVGSPALRRERAQRMLAEVGLDADTHRRFAHELSGGQRQRAVIARALVLEPRLLICDEPVSALDVSIQAQVVNLLQRLRRELDLTLVFISHDLSLVRYLCDRVAVMYLGRIVEEGPVERVFAAPRHPYTQVLIAAIPVPDPSRRGLLPALPGEPPSPFAPPPGCAFHPRCREALDQCRSRLPALLACGDGRQVACHAVHGSGGETARGQA